MVEKPWLQMTGRERAGFDRTRMQPMVGPHVRGYCDGCDEWGDMAYRAQVGRGERHYCAECVDATEMRS